MVLIIGKGVLVNKEYGIDGFLGVILILKGVDGLFKYWFG